MKEREKGFTLIKLLVVIAIISILATTLAPKLKGQLAKAKDSKTIAVLGAARMVGNIILFEKMVLDSTSNDAILISAKEIYDRLGSKAQSVYKDKESHYLKIGGSRNQDGKEVAYNGVVYYDKFFASGIESVIRVQDESLDLILKPYNSGSSIITKKYSMEGKRWSDY
ncbi:type II secretion system protein [Psychrilyobacter sp.]|uniref:type II secretion system protein n=1 Tax=Psychrilyobacter sp. TaxID=2586924 RepID=UPI003017CFFF